MEFSFERKSEKTADGHKPAGQVASLWSSETMEHINGGSS